MNKKQWTTLVVGSGLLIAGSAFAGAAATAGEGCDKAGGSRGSARFGEIDQNQDGKVTLAELTAARESWLTKVDTNKDNVATQAEIDAALQAGRRDRNKARFEREDADDNGRLTRAETRLPSAWFEKADTNKDGALTLSEFSDARQAAAAQRTGAHTGKAARFDRNADGKVDRQELRSAAAEQFARLDANKDGSLSGDEFHVRGHGHGRHRRGADGQKDGLKPINAPIPS